MNKKITWLVNIPEEVLTECVGVELSQYYNNPRIMYDVQMRAGEFFEKRFSIPFQGVAPTYSAYIPVSVLGVPVKFPRDNVPEVEFSQGMPFLKKIEDFQRIKVPDNPGQHGLLAKLIKAYHFMKETAPVNVKVKAGLNEIQGPFTSAVVMRGMNFFLDIVDNPGSAHALLELLTENAIKILHTSEEITGKGRDEITLADDFAGMISPVQYEEFSFPYLEKIYKAFPNRKRYIHCETLTGGHLHFLEKLGIDFYDVGAGVNETLSPELLKLKLNIPFRWYIRTKELMFQSVKVIENKYSNDVKKGARHMGTELCRGLDYRKIEAFVRIAKRYEKISIDMDLI